MKNTLKNGQVRVIVFKEAGTWYAAALEFNIVESGNDPREVMLLLDEAIRGYLESARKAKISNSTLNQKTDKEYEDLWSKIKSNKPILSPIQVYSSSSLMLSSLV